MSEQIGSGEQTGSGPADWTTERREPGWFGRLVMPEGGGRPATMAFLVAFAGAAAFAGSLALEWMSLTIPEDGFQLEASNDDRVFGVSLINGSTMGQVYALAGIALLGVVGSVITRPMAALRLRMGVTGAALGLLALVTAAHLSLADRALEQLSGASVIMLRAEYTGVSTALEAGVFCAYAAVVLPVVAVWLVSRRAARGHHATVPTTGAVAGLDSAPPTPAGAVATSASRQADFEENTPPLAPADGRISIGGLTVSPSEPIDLSVTPEAWPR